MFINDNPIFPDVVVGASPQDPELRDALGGLLEKFGILAVRGCLDQLLPPKPKGRPTYGLGNKRQDLGPVAFMGFLAKRHPELTKAELAERAIRLFGLAKRKGGRPFLAATKQLLRIWDAAQAPPPKRRLVYYRWVQLGENLALRPNVGEAEAKKTFCDICHLTR